LRTKRAGNVFPRWQGFAGLLAVFFGILFLLYSSQFTHFYMNKQIPVTPQTGDLKVLFANIHKDNTDYT